MVEQNLRFRANSDNPDEVRAVSESFSPSVVWGFEAETTRGDAVIVDATPFLLRDSHGIARSLKQREEGNFQIAESRSAVYRPRTKAFPDNTEIEATVTFVGETEGDILPTVVTEARSTVSATS